MGNRPVCSYSFEKQAFLPIPIQYQLQVPAVDFNYCPNTGQKLDCSTKTNDSPAPRRLFSLNLSSETWTISPPFDAAKNLALRRNEWVNSGCFASSLGFLRLVGTCHRVTISFSPRLLVWGNIPPKSPSRGSDGIRNSTSNFKVRPRNEWVNTVRFASSL